VWGKAVTEETEEAISESPLLNEPGFEILLGAEEFLGRPIVRHTALREIRQMPAVIVIHNLSGIEEISPIFLFLSPRLAPLCSVTTMSVSFNSQFRFQ
jgi:hypothetical protein